MIRFWWMVLPVLVVLLVAVPTARAEVPPALHLQGALADDAGEPLEGAHSLVVTIYDAATEGNALWTETYNLTITGGVLDLILGGDANPITANLFAGATGYWVGIKIDTDQELTPRLPVASVPFAFQAQRAESAANVPTDEELMAMIADSGFLTEETDPTVNQLARATFTCEPNQVVVWTGTAWGCADDRIGENMSQSTIEDWARGVCYDNPAELTAALATVYAALGHDHDDRYYTKEQTDTLFHSLDEIWTALVDSINNESSERRAADQALTDALFEAFNALEEADFNLRVSLLDEADAREAADNTLATSLNNEIAERAAADQTLTGDLTDETFRAQDAEDALGSRLDNEAAARQAGDTQLRADLESLASSETAARQQADGQLSAALATETAARQAADNTLTTNLNNEIAARRAADNGLHEDLLNFSAYGDLTGEGRLNNDDGADLPTRDQADGRYAPLAHTHDDYALQAALDAALTEIEQLKRQSVRTAGFALILPGTFTMGSPIGELGRDPGEVQHPVRLTYRFEMQQREITQGEFNNLMGYNPSSFSACGSSCPVENITWHEALACANAMSRREGLAECFDCTGTAPNFTCALKNAYPNPYPKPQDCPGYRLPTEAEWEYAYRAGTTTAFYNGTITNTACSPLDTTLDLIGWYCGNGSSTTHQTGSKQPNNWGLYDMAGNVLEWTWDWHTDYPSGSVTDPTGGASSLRAIRGGSWNYSAWYCRAAFRGVGNPTSRNVSTGFRLVRTLP